MQTLEELRSGKLKGTKELKISQDLSSFPVEILDLVDSLELLDLSNNRLSSLPKEMSRFKKLKIAFFSNNDFTTVPTELKECENLYMLGFKANKIENFEEDILPLSISWLILTDNKIKKLPNSLGKLSKLQKCALAGNQIEVLPSSMKECKNLELLRLSANRLREIPSWLLELPKLSWLAFSGNPCSISKQSHIKVMAHSDVDVKELLGEGASGKIYRGHAKDIDRVVAIKLFKGAVTSDGYAEDEMNAYMSIGEHPNLIKVLARFENSKPLGLVLEYIPSSFVSLGNPPNFDTCTRDTFEDGTAFSVEAIKKIAKAIASASKHLHKIGLNHGDLYAHNILVDKENSTYLVDFGAASFYDIKNVNYEKVEVRAFGSLLDDLLTLCDERDEELENLRDRCMSEDVESRPLFDEVLATLSNASKE